MDNPAEDKENQLVTRQKKADNRRSSILKSNRLSELDLNTKIEAQVTRRISRRVSFAETYVVKEFLSESPQRWNLEPDSPKHESGFDKLLTGTIQSQNRDCSDENVYGTESQPEDEQDGLHLLQTSLQDFENDDKDVFLSFNKVVFPNQEPELEQKIDSRSFLSQFSTSKHLTSSILGQPDSDTLLDSRVSDCSHSKVDSKSFLEKLKGFDKPATGNIQSQNGEGSNGIGVPNRLHLLRNSLPQFESGNKEELLSCKTSAEFLNQEPELEQKIDSRSFLSQFSTSKRLISSVLGQPDSDTLLDSKISDGSHNKVDSKSFLEKLKGFVTKVPGAAVQSAMKLPTRATGATPSVQDSMMNADLFGERSKLNKSLTGVKADTRSSKDLFASLEPANQNSNVFNMDASMHMTCQNIDLTDKSVLVDSDNTRIFDDDTMDMTCSNILDMTNKSAVMNNSVQFPRSVVDNGGISVAGQRKLPLSIRENTLPEMIYKKTSNRTGLPTASAADIKTKSASVVPDWTKTYKLTDNDDGDNDATMDLTCQNIPDMKNKSDAGQNRIVSNASHDVVFKEIYSHVETDSTRIFRTSDDTALMEMTCQNLQDVNTQSAAVESGHTIIFGKGKDMGAMDMTCELMSSNSNETNITDVSHTQIVEKSEDVAVNKITLPNAPVVIVKSTVPESGLTTIFGKGNHADAMEMTCEIVPGLGDKSTNVEANHTRIFDISENPAAMEMTCAIDLKLNATSTVTETGHTIVFGKENDAAAMEMTCEIRNKSTIEANHTRIFGTSEDTAAMNMTCASAPNSNATSTVTETGHTIVFGKSNNAAAMEMTCEIRNASTIEANHTRGFESNIAEANQTKIFGTSENTAAMEITCATFPSSNTTSVVAESGHTIVFGKENNTAAMEMTCEIIPPVGDKSTNVEANCTKIFGTSEDNAVMEMTCATVSNLNSTSTVADSGHTVVFGKGNDVAAMEMTCEIIHGVGDKSTIAEANRTRIFGTTENTAAMELTCNSLPEVHPTATGRSRVVLENDLDTVTCENTFPDIKDKSSLFETNHTKTFMKTEVVVVSQNDPDGKDADLNENHPRTNEKRKPSDDRDKSAMDHSIINQSPEADHTLTIAWGKISLLKASITGRDCTRTLEDAIDTAARETSYPGTTAVKDIQSHGSDSTRIFGGEDSCAVMEMTCSKISEIQKPSGTIINDCTRVTGDTEVTSAMEMACMIGSDFKPQPSAVDRDCTRMFANNDSVAAMEMTCQSILDFKDKSINVDFDKSRRADGTNGDQAAATFCRRSMSNPPRSIPDPLALSNTLKHKLYAFDMVMAGAKAKSIKLLNTGSADVQYARKDITSADSVINGRHDLSTTATKVEKTSEFAVSEATDTENSDVAAVPIMTTSHLLPVVGKMDKSCDITQSNKTQAQEESKQSGYTFQSKSTPHTASSDEVPKVNSENTLSDLTLRLKQQVDRTLTKMTSYDAYTAGERSDCSRKSPPESDDAKLAVVQGISTSSSSKAEIESGISEQMISSELAVLNDLPIPSDLVLSMNSTSSEERTLNYMSQTSMNQSRASVNPNQSSMNQSQVSANPNQSSMNQSQLNLSRTSSSCPIHEKFCKKMDIAHKDWLKIRTSQFMQELEADTLQDILKIQTLKVCKYDVNETLLSSLMQENENMELEIDNIKIAMDESQPHIFDVIENADQTELEELKEKVNSCKCICWKKAKPMWKRKQIHRNLDYIKAMQEQRSVLHNALDDIITQTETVQNVITQLEELSADLKGETGDVQTSGCADGAEFAEHHLLVEKEHELKRCLKQNEDILREQKLAGEKTWTLDKEHSQLIDALIESCDSKTTQQEEASETLNWKLQTLKSIHRWELKEQSPAYFVFLFFYGSLELTVLFEPGQMDTINCISLVSHLSDESSLLVKLAVHLILDATDTTKLKERYSTKDRLPRLLHEVSYIVGRVHTAVDEIDHVSLRNTVDIKENIITVSVRNIAKIRKVSLSFTLRPSGYPLEISEYDIVVHIGNITADEMRKHLATVTSGCDYCLRLVNEMKRYIHL
ncbi:uncharacterized protein LOC121369697 [Gigantopelta aegis]|uniref:uncharacterized protein LOC121369697 n=1 Tax=Gigantopelta aegis TaxID=1735272 RepID=UPI001B889314|nr:uncharacterized protein LOC121369697 [Gigantopelta aegis]